MTKLNLLVPLDGTAFSRKIRPEVARLFPADRFDLHLLHISRLPLSVSDAMHQPALVGPDATLYAYGMGQVGSELHPLYDEDELEEFRESLKEELAEEKALFDEEGYDAKLVVHFGEPARGIVDYANDQDVDVIAMATHGRSGFGRLILGSVAKDVLEHVEAPMLLLRAREQEPAESNDASSA